MMGWIQNLIDLFYNDEEGIIIDNIYIFITYGIICFGISAAINKCLNNYLKKKYEKAKDRIKELQDEKDKLEIENKALIKKYVEYNEIPRLMMGTDDDFSSPSAEMISNDINKDGPKHFKTLRRLISFLKI